jgi:hypothetical protein
LYCMIGFRHILCPTNLTPESNAALRYAVALASAKVVQAVKRGQPYREILSYAIAGRNI